MTAGGLRVGHNVRWMGCTMHGVPMSSQQPRTHRDVGARSTPRRAQQRHCKFQCTVVSKPISRSSQVNPCSLLARPRAMYTHQHAVIRHAKWHLEEGEPAETA